jgi:hypothetical protein
VPWEKGPCGFLSKVKPVMFGRIEVPTGGTFSHVRFVLLFDTAEGFRYNCALVVASSESCEFSLAICQMLMYITPLVLA